ncbi:MAG: tRNA (N(6)-L-threonylcarbamoyladenosine(37)-C(2))-methylthiotransferase MtaB [Bacteroidales bacterium]|nr:tRNA (N(6)-L-threonylcarbamoyladenosine(37)-C(2))-methylthiotransferase MtaB [Bacteroidales bacterium]
MKKRLAFHTLGCKLNFSETSTIARMFPKSEYEIVDFKSEADYYVINSCSVTGVAEKKCKTAAKQAKKRNPDAMVTMMGCFSQIKPETVARFEAVDLVLGNEDKFNLPEYLSNPQGERATEVYVLDLAKSKVFSPAYSTSRTRSFLKVQDGCDHFCTYCSIPFARGRSRSGTIAQTIAKAKEVGRTDTREIILTGVNIGDFGKGTEESFYDLLVELEKVPGIERIRISSVEPELLTDEIIELVAKSKVFLPHFHLPLQSGCDKTLLDMKRFYDTALYANRVEKIKNLLPHACIAADLIVGFPTETEEDFAQTKQFIADLPISYVHVFTYSQRENTNALRMQNVVSPPEKKKRSQRLHELSERKRLQFYRENIGTTRKVLWEAEVQGGMMSGWTENYIKVITPYRSDLENTVQEVKLKELNIEGVFEA